MGASVKRYPFPVAEWCRIIWTSQHAKTLWEPRLQRISLAWAAAERASVGQFRGACRQSVAPEQMAGLSEMVTKAGFSLTILGQHGADSYQAGSKALAPGQAWSYQIAITQSAAHGKAFLAAHKAGDDVTIGELLGFPPCCIQFFTRVWNEERWIDTTWPMALNSVMKMAGGSADQGNSLTYSNPPAQNNILLRWLGVRLVPHLPCSVHCQGTAAFGTLFSNLLARDFPEERVWMHGLLTSNVEWSELKGIAEIKLPILKISAKSDATAEKLTVTFKGHDHLEGASRGNVFPFLPGRRVEALPMTFHKNNDHRDNGFATAEAEAKAHGVIREFYRSLELPADAYVLDLGCGNGSLARSLSLHAEGVESNVERVAKATIKVHYQTIQEFVRGSRDAYDCVLFMPGRLSEMTPEEAGEVVEWLWSQDQVIVYCYGDWDLREVLEAHGLASTEIERAEGVQMALLV